MAIHLSESLNSHFLTWVQPSFGSLFFPLLFWDVRWKWGRKAFAACIRYSVHSAQQSGIFFFYLFFWRFLRSSWNYYPLLFIEMNKSLKKKKKQLTSSRISLYTFKLVLLLSLFLPPSIMSNCVVVINNLREKHLLVHLSQSVCFSWKNGISQFFQVNIFPLLSFQFQILSRRIFIVS